MAAEKVTVVTTGVPGWGQTPNPRESRVCENVAFQEKSVGLHRYFGVYTEIVGVIPKEIRARHHWKPGTELIIEERGDALVLRAAKPFPPTRLEDGLGCTGYSGPAKNPAEMDAGVSEALRREWKDTGS